MEELSKNGAEDIPVIIGGIVPPQDEGELIKMGVNHVFRGSLVRNVVNYLYDYFKISD
jgi:methylmalonyl-CoA mutase cobalamin-binding domain/chain